MKRLWIHAVALTCLVGTASFAAPRPAATAYEALEEQVDTLIRDGFERRDQSVLVLQQLLRDHPSADAQRLVLQGIGIVEARGGSAVRAGALAEQLLALSPDDPGGRAVASSNLVRAEVSATAGQVDIAAALAQQALPVFMAGCPSAAPGASAEAAMPMNPAASALESASMSASVSNSMRVAVPTSTTGAAPTSVPPASTVPPCDYRSAWRALRILERRSQTLGVNVAAAGHAQTGLRLAEWAGDALRQTTALASLAWLAQDRGEPELAQRYLGQARHLASQPPDPMQQARLSNTDAHLFGKLGDRQAALRAREDAYAFAVQAHAPRLQAQMLANLSDDYARMGRHADALHAADVHS